MHLKEINNDAHVVLHFYTETPQELIEKSAGTINAMHNLELKNFYIYIENIVLLYMYN